MSGSFYLNAERQTFLFSLAMGAETECLSLRCFSYSFNLLIDFCSVSDNSYIQYKFTA